MLSSLLHGSVLDAMLFNLFINDKIKNGIIRFEENKEKGQSKDFGGQY